MTKKELLENIKKELYVYADNIDLPDSMLFDVIISSLGNDNFIKILKVAVKMEHWENFFKKYGWIE